MFRFFPTSPFVRYNAVQQYGGTVRTYVRLNAGGHLEARRYKRVRLLSFVANFGSVFFDCLPITGTPTMLLRSLLHHRYSCDVAAVAATLFFSFAPERPALPE